MLELSWRAIICFTISYYWEETFQKHQQFYTKNSIEL